MRRFHKLISCYLAFCLTFAGAVGISPTLHRLIEHGGQGPAHTHAGGVLRADGLSPLGHIAAFHHHNHEDIFIKHHAPKRLFAHEHEFELPRIPVASLWHALNHLLESDSAEAPDSSENAPSHHHESLPQLMVNGLMDLHVEFPLPEHAVFLLASSTLRGDALVLVQGWDAQTAPRGPPLTNGWLA